MNKAWLKNIAIYNLTDLKKGEIILKPNFNIVLSDTNDQGKTLLANSLFYSLGNSYNPFEAINPNDHENLNEILVKSVYVLGEDEFTFYRASSKTDSNIGSRIYIYKNGEYLKDYKYYGHSGNSFMTLYKDIYNALEIPNIIAITNDKGANNRPKISMPDLPSLMGFFVIKQNNKNDEFKAFDDKVVSRSNKWNVDGRILSFMYLNDRISDKEALEVTVPSYDEKLRKKLVHDKKEDSRIIEKLESSSEFKVEVTNDVVVKALKSYNDDREKLDKISNKLIESQQEMLRVKNALKYLRSKTTKINNFVDKVSEETFKYFDVETNKTFDIPARVLFNKLTESDVSETYDELIVEQKKIQAKIDEIEKQYNEQDARLSKDFSKLNSLKENKEMSIGKDVSSFILDKTVNEFRNDLELVQTQIKEMDEKVRIQTEEQEKLLSSLKGMESFYVNGVKELIKEMDSIQPGTSVYLDNHIDIYSFPIQKTSNRLNTGSSILSYALTKLLFYIRNIKRINVPQIIEYEGTDEADRSLIEYNKKTLNNIIEESVTNSHQLIIFKNKKNNDSYYDSSFINMDDKKYEYELIPVDSEHSGKTHNLISTAMSSAEIDKCTNIYMNIKK